MEEPSKPDKINGTLKPDDHLLPDAMLTEYTWLGKVLSSFEHFEGSENSENVSWAAFHVATQPPITRPTAINALLPMFHEKAKTHAMILHTMKIMENAAKCLDERQTPVIGMDQPLYALAKEIQRSSSTPYTEENYVVVLGGLHIEMCILKLLGDWLEKCGWDSALVQASIMTAGKANAFLKASYVTRTRYAHQVTAATLYFPQKQTHECSDDSETFENWCKRKAEQHPQFLYWAIVLELELLLMTYVRSLRIGDFLFYIQVLGKLVPWAFALNHHNYARWLPVHIRDMVTLKEKHPAVLQQFLKGHFVVQKSNRRFLMMALDHNHKQQNQIIKAEGGTVGRMENPAALTRWMIAGSEVARVVTEFKENVQPSIDNVNADHHDQKKRNKKSFMKDVSSLINTMQEMGNRSAKIVKTSLHLILNR